MTKGQWETASHDPGDMRREMEEGHGGRLVNMLVGLIINANDAYERSGQAGRRVISIELDRTKTKHAGGRQGKARIRVVDWAQGMDYEDFGNFGAYGAAKSRWVRGANITGLFGREASDIMWSNVGSRYVSIKDGKGYVCEFRPPVNFQRFELDRRATKQFQEEYDVGQGNFTLAEFYLNQDHRLPPHDHLVKSLKNHFRLRLINSKPSVELWFQYTDSKGRRKPQRITFTSLDAHGDGADLLSQETFELGYKRYPPFVAEGRLYRKRERELTQSGPEREGGILIYSDDETVLELSLFSFDDGTFVPYTGRLFGYLKLNVAAILRQELREADHRIALIAVDRSQLKRRTDFFEMLKTRAESWLKPFVDAERERMAQTRAVQVTEEWNRRLRPLFAEINRVINQKTGQSAAQVKGSDGTPPEAMEFARSKVTTSAGTVYRVNLLCNTNVVPPGSRVILESDNRHVIAQPTQDLVPRPNHRMFDDVAVIVLRLSAERVDEQAIVTATAPGYASASLAVHSIEPDVYFPHEGIEWQPGAFEAVGGRISHPTLWVDLTRVTDAGVIRVSSPSEAVKVLDQEVVPSAVRVLKDDPSVGIRVGKVRPRFQADGRRGRGTLEAVWETLRDTLTFEIVDLRQPPAPGNWTFSGIDFEENEDRKEMDVYPTSEGMIILNVRHPLIASYFGTNTDEAISRVRSDTSARRHAAHLVVDCILNDLSRKAWRNEHGPNANIEIGTRDPTNMAWQVYTYVMKLKAQYGVRWVQSIVEQWGR